MLGFNLLGDALLADVDFTNVTDPDNPDNPVVIVLPVWSMQCPDISSYNDQSVSLNGWTDAAQSADTWTDQSTDRTINKECS